jgi:hypothetical protein
VLRVAALCDSTRTLASELIGRNIRVNAETPLFGKLGLPEANPQQLGWGCLR